MVETRPALLPDDRDAIDALVAAAAARDGFPALSEEASVALERVEGGCGWLALDGGRPAAFAHRRGHRGVTVVEVASAGERRAAAVAALVDAVRDEAGGPVRLWSADPVTTRAILGAGAAPGRRLVRLQRSLEGLDPPEAPPGIRVARFRRGVDEGAYLVVANDAFRGHPESGAWTRETFEERAARDWFDPDGLLLAWERGRPVGACWTKVHPVGIGEIYSIAVRPAAAGRGLGTALVVAGFASLAGRGIEVGMLWADRANEAAVRLYTALGMETVRERCEALLPG